jgi:hypothetical protein
LIFVLASVEKGTYLVHPSFASVTLNPTLFVNFVILLLEELFFPYCDIAKLNCLAILQFLKTQMAPVILVVPTNIVVAIPTNSLRWAV